MVCDVTWEMSPCVDVGPAWRKSSGVVSDSVWGKSPCEVCGVVGHEFILCTICRLVGDISLCVS